MNDPLKPEATERKAGEGLAAASGSAPLWYTADELRHYLTAFEHYSDEIANELATGYAHNLQRAFEKGWEMATRKVQNSVLADT